MTRLNDSTRARKWAAVLLPLALLTGCGTTKKHQATEHLLMSDAVDRAVEQVNFRAISGAKVYFDTKYIKTVKGQGFVNADYIISSLRQQLVAANCLLQDKAEEAEVIVEARVGVLGTDSHDVNYGIPASQPLNSAASLVAGAPAMPMVPEISLARKSDQRGAAKLGVFAYDRLTRAPIWQSGTSLAQSTASDTWVLGAGPFQRGTIYDRPQFAGSRLEIPSLIRLPGLASGPVSYSEEHFFQYPPRPADGFAAPLVQAPEPDARQNGAGTDANGAASAEPGTPSTRPRVARDAAESDSGEGHETARIPIPGNAASGHKRH